MEVRKKGVVNVHMVFEQGKKNMTYYTTPYGTIEMGIAATNLNLQESDGGLDMKVDYALDMNQDMWQTVILRLRHSQRTVRILQFDQIW